MKLYLKLISTIFIIGCSNLNKPMKENSIDSNKTINIKQPIKQIDSTEEKQYDFAKTLKGGYSLSYIVDDSDQHLFLVKGKFRKEISSEDKYNSQTSLGIKAADFDNSFVLLHLLSLHHRNGSDPNPFELIEKKTGNVIFKNYFIDADEKNNSILYFNPTKETFGDSMFLYNIVTKEVKSFVLPVENKEDGRLINRIKIKSLSTKSLKVSFFNDVDFENEIVKEYNLSSHR